MKFDFKYEIEFLRNDFVIQTNTIVNFYLKSYEDYEIKITSIYKNSKQMIELKEKIFNINQEIYKINLNKVVIGEEFIKYNNEELQNKILNICCKSEYQKNIKKLNEDCKIREYSESINKFQIYNSYTNKFRRKHQILSEFLGIYIVPEPKNKMVKISLKANILHSCSPNMGSFWIKVLEYPKNFVKTDPLIDENLMNKWTIDLNRDDNFILFLCRIREEFKKLI
ncbi:uncharacterized protein LOC135932046 isoform X2 [Gordionus sp. m RMFG-2023]|uniref:uncharacterized protein LOC135932046 isoform X2 n=1 Tax=Gordionus sp. m RMFG-2023 TaxID=3053472 RepID=UPI0031FD8F51